VGPIVTGSILKVAAYRLVTCYIFSNYIGCLEFQSSISLAIVPLNTAIAF